MLKNSFRAWWNQIDPEIENQLENHIFVKHQLTNRSFKYTLDLKRYLLYKYFNELPYF